MRNRIVYGERIDQIMDFVLVLTRIEILISITQVFFRTYLILCSTREKYPSFVKKMLHISFMI